MLDAFESMLFHELMNHLTFVVYPPDSLPAEESLEFSKFSGKQILTMLNTIRYVKLYEKNELRALPSAIHPGQLFEKTISEFKPITSGKNQTCTFEHDGIDKIIADEELLKIYFWNILSIFTKYAPEKSIFEVKTTASENFLTLDISHPHSYAGEYYKAVNFDNFGDALLNNQGFERSIAIKLLACKYMMAIHNAAFRIFSIGDRTNFSARFSGFDADKRENDNNDEKNKNIRLDKAGMKKTEPLIQALKNTDFYKITRIYDILSEIEMADPCENTQAWAKTAKMVLESGKKDDFEAFLDNTLNYFHS